MNLAHLASRPRSAGDWGARLGFALVSATLFATGTMLHATGAAAAGLSTSGLTRVSVASFQALPPPYKPGHAVLRSAASLRSFERVLQADHVVVTSHAANAGGCSGGIQYTVVMTYNSGRHMTLDAYDCGGTITGNLSGNVKQFVKYLSGLLP